MFGMARRGATFVVRQPGQLQGERVGHPTRQGTIRRGSVHEQALLLRAPDTGETMRVRRLTLTLKEPTRAGDTRFTSSPMCRPNERPPLNWRGSMANGGRQTAFFEITTTLACEINTLGSPKAALLTFCLALLAYNAVSLVKAALRSAHGRQKR